MIKYTEEQKNYIRENRSNLGESLERVYKIPYDVDDERFADIVQLCESYEESRTFEQLYVYYHSHMPEYLYQLGWLVYDMNCCQVSSNHIAQSSKMAKKYIRQRKHLNDFIEFARKRLKKSYSETLSFLYIAGRVAA